MVDLEAAGALLLIHSGELEDVRALLDELGLGFEEMRPSKAAIHAYRHAAIAIAGPQFLIDRLDDCEGEAPVRIAVLESEARTLRSMLSRGGVEWMVRRPFHPAALRLLLLHCIYRGPEKRRTRRVSVGAAVRVQSGWRKRGALLADLSERDCRLLCERPSAMGRRVRVRLPAELMGRRALVLDGEVVRTAQGSAGDEAHEVCIVFRAPDPADAVRLKDLISRHERGPAVLSGREARFRERNRTAGPADPSPPRKSVISFEPREPDAAPDAGAAGPGPGGDAAPDRRRDPRHDFRRRVIALGEEATRVLVGRDISLRGMRVDSTSSLSLGEQFQIAIHVPDHDTPLVVDVQVDRHDGERGAVLSFRDLSPTAERYLQEVLSGLGGVGSLRGGGAGDVNVVSEIVEPRRV